MTKRHQQAKHRRGAALLLCVLACLLVVIGLVLSLTQSALQARRETRLRIQMRQTDYLLDAGVMRAANRLRESTDYAGEQWRPKLKRFDNALVRIKITADSANADQRNVEVTADVGGRKESTNSPSVNRTRRKRTLTISISQANSPDAEQTR